MNEKITYEEAVEFIKNYKPTRKKVSDINIMKARMTIGMLKNGELLSAWNYNKNIFEKSIVKELDILYDDSNEDLSSLYEFLEEK